MHFLKANHVPTTVLNVLYGLRYLPLCLQVRYHSYTYCTDENTVVWS